MNLPEHQHPYEGPERRRMPLSEEQLELIAEKAASKAMEKLTSHIYQSVGKSVITRIFWLAGAATVGIALWLNAKGVVTFK